MSEHESDTSLEGCPICQHKECQRHLLACFDKLGGDGEFGIGILGGALIDATEIPKVLERAELAWVQSVRATGKPKSPPWIVKESGLRSYFDALGGIDLDKYDSDEDAASDLAACSDNALEVAREEFLSENLSCLTTEKEVHFGASGATIYQYWWADDPKEIVENFRAKLQSMLLEANSG